MIRHPQIVQAILVHFKRTTYEQNEKGNEARKDQQGVQDVHVSFRTVNVLFQAGLYWEQMKRLSGGPEDPVSVFRLLNNHPAWMRPKSLDVPGGSKTGNPS